MSHHPRPLIPRRRLSRSFTLAVLVLAALALFWPSIGSRLAAATRQGETAATGGASAGSGDPFTFFSPFTDPSFSRVEVAALLLVLGVAIAGLLYALALVRQVRRAGNGTPRMQEIAAAVREGANSYLAAQFRRIGPLIALITVLLAVTYTGSESAFRFGRAGAFLVGALFSWTVGFVGMRLATTGNLRVAAAAPVGFGKALMLGYRTGTITGMLTDGLGLLGGTLIFMTYGERA